MIEVNKEMTWEQAVKAFHGKRILAEVYKRVVVDNCKIPENMLVVCVAETDQDEDEIDKAEYYNQNYSVIYVPNTTDILARILMMGAFHNRVLSD